MTLLAALVAEESAHSLPMPAWVFGVIALVVFALLLAATWSFRGAAQKYAQPGDHGHAHGHGDAAGHADGHGHH